MRVYFDTNVYSFVSSCHQGEAVQSFLDAVRCTVQASSNNLFEIYAIPDSTSRDAELRTLITVASSFEKKPESWLHAREVRAEIERCRPNWLRRVPSRTLLAKSRDFLGAHLSRWEDAKNLKAPPALAYAAYHRDAESGISSKVKEQKVLRQLASKGQLRSSLLISRGGELVPLTTEEPESADSRWRYECLVVWHNAIVQRVRASRDYADWLLPYIKEDAFFDPTYPQFWLNDVEARRVPRNRICGLADYYQRQHKVTHGNAADALHAANLLDADVFVTADRAFFDVLQKVRSNHYTGHARLILLTRSASSALEELESALGRVNG